MKGLHLELLKTQLAHPNSRLLWLLLPFGALGMVFIGADFAGEGVNVSVVVSQFFLWSVVFTRAVEGDAGKWRAFGLTRRQASMHALLVSVPIMLLCAALSLYNLRGAEWLWAAVTALGFLSMMQVFVQVRFIGVRWSAGDWNWGRPTGTGPLAWRMMVGPGLRIAVLVAVVAGALVSGLLVLGEGRYYFYAPLVTALCVALPPAVATQTMGGALAAWQAVSGTRRSWTGHVIALVIISAVTTAVGVGIAHLAVGVPMIALPQLLTLLIPAAVMIGWCTAFDNRIANGAMGALAGGGGVFLTVEPDWGPVLCFAVIFLIIDATLLYWIVRGVTRATRQDFRNSRV